MLAGIGVFLVSVYFLLVSVWLILSRRIPAPGLGRVIRASFRRPYKADLAGIRRERGYCWVAGVPAELLSDLESASSVQLFEDERPLGPPHSTHADVRAFGGGRFAHWGPELYFSTSDNTDPLQNGRRYHIEERAR
jgi:hypothetical protein